MSDSQRDFLLAGLWKEQETNSPWRRERKTVFPEGNDRCGGQGRPRMALPGAQVEGGLPRGGRSWVFCIWTLLVAGQRLSCGRFKAEHGHVKSKACRHAKLYRTLVL